MAKSSQSPPRARRGALLVPMLLLPLGPFFLDWFVFTAPPGGRRGEHTRVARNQAQSELPAGTEMLQTSRAKQLLRTSFTEGAVRMLEATKDGVDVVELAQLRGEWSLQVPKTGDVKKWMARHGARFGMKLSSSPRLTLARDGNGESRFLVKWGLTLATVLQRSDFQLLGPNELLEIRRSVRSDKVGLPLPILSRPRKLRITFYDGEVLVARDDDGFVDVLWRRGGANGADASAVRKNNIAGALSAAMAAAAQRVPKESSEPVSTKSDVVSKPTDFSSMVNTMGELQGLLEERRSRAAHDREARKKLAKDIRQMEKDFKKISASTQVEAVKLWAMEELDAQLTERLSQHGDELDEQSRQLWALKAEVEALEGKVEAQRSIQSQAAAHETSLTDQIQMMKSDKKGRSGGNRQAYRVALQKVKAERKDARRQTRDARKVEDALLRELKSTAAKIDPQQRQVDETMARQQTVQGRLEAQRNEAVEQREQRALMDAQEEEANLKLEKAREELQRLNAQEADAYQMAVEAEQALKKMAKQVREAQSTVQRLAAEAGRSQEAKVSARSLRNAISHGWPWW